MILKYFLDAYKFLKLKPGQSVKRNTYYIVPTSEYIFKNVTTEMSIWSSHRAYFHRYSDSFKKPSTTDSGTCESQQKHKYQKFPKFWFSSSLQYQEKNEQVGERESCVRPGPVSFSSLCKTWTEDQPHPFMQAPCSSHMHLSIDSLGIAYNGPVAS